ncbi:MAG: universal stress protein [Proteobacteria bacterium]|nr:universal stress protein [Pseudomonadota bacterium]
MAIRTILLPLSSLETDAAATELALLIARHFDAHVMGLHVRMDPRDIAPLAGEGLSGAMIEEMMEVCEKDGIKQSGGARKLFEDACAKANIPFVDSPGPQGANLSASWRSEVGREEDNVVWHSRVNDLTVIARPQAGGEKSTTEVLHAAIMGAGRGVLVAPAKAPSICGKRIAIAWNGSAEAAGAVSVGKPFLERCEALCLMSAEEGYSHGPGVSELESHLRWHGLHPEIRHFGAPGENIGASLLQRLAEYGADLLIMGAYTHSRLRHLILGGVTSHVLAHAELPILMHR